MSDDLKIINESLEQILAELESEARAADLVGAHACEYIPDGAAAGEPVTHALAAAFAFGRAHGLRAAGEAVHQRLELVIREKPV
jgi:hypothetical protein